MMLLDIIVFTISAFFGVFALSRGLIKEVFGIGGLVIAYIATYMCGDVFADFFNQFISNIAVANVISNLSFYFIVMFCCGIISGIATGIINIAGLTMINRLLAFPVGCIKGLFFGFIVYIVIIMSYPIFNPSANGSKSINDSLPPWISKAIVYPYFFDLQKMIEKNLETGNLAKHIGSSKVGVTDGIKNNMDIDKIKKLGSDAVSDISYKFMKR